LRWTSAVGAGEKKRQGEKERKSGMEWGPKETFVPEVSVGGGVGWPKVSVPAYGGGGKQVIGIKLGGGVVGSESRVGTRMGSWTKEEMRRPRCWRDTNFVLLEPEGGNRVCVGGEKVRPAGLEVGRIFIKSQKRKLNLCLARGEAFWEG